MCSKYLDGGEGEAQVACCALEARLVIDLLLKSNALGRVCGLQGRACWISTISKKAACCTAAPSHIWGTCRRLRWTWWCWLRLHNRTQGEHTHHGREQIQREGVWFYVSECSVWLYARMCVCASVCEGDKRCLHYVRDVTTRAQRPLVGRLLSSVFVRSAKPAHQQPLAPRDRCSRHRLCGMGAIQRGQR